MIDSLEPNAIYPANFPRGVVVRQPGSVVRAEPTGLASCNETFRGRYADMVSLDSLSLYNGPSIQRSYLSAHPTFPSLRVYTASITQGRGILDGTLAVEYRGLDPALSFPPPPVYETEVSTGNEPLRTHPQWALQIAGTPSVPLNGSQWISTVVRSDGSSVTDYNPSIVTGSLGPGPNFNAEIATFNQWLATSPFAGVDDYLVPGVIFKKTYTAYNLPDLSAVGSFSGPDGPAPGLPDNSDWFFLGVTAEDNCGLFRIEATWKAVPTGTAARIIYGG